MSNDRIIAEDEIKKSYQSQEVLNRLLKISIEKVSLTEQLEQALDVILSISWMPTLPKGGIFIVEDTPGVLVLKVKRGLPAALLEVCNRVSFGRCLCGQAAISRNIEFADCIDERHENIYKGIISHGHYNVPIILDEQVIGVLLLYLDKGHKRDDREIIFLEAVANTLAGMIKHAYMHKKLETRARQQDVVAYLGHKALKGKDLTDLMNEVVKKIAETLDNEYCKVLELLPDGNEMLLRAGVGLKKGLVGHATVHTGLDSQAGYTLRSKKPVIVEDLKTETRFSGPPLLHEHNVVSGMSIVIQGQNGPWGVLGTHTIMHKKFSKDDINFLHSIANLLASAIARKKSENALKESEEKYRKLIETAQDAILCDVNGIITEWNKSAENVFGYSRSEIIGKNIEALIPDKYKKEHLEGLERFLKTGESRIIGKTVEVTGITKKGVKIPIEMSLSYQKTREGRYIFTAIVRDITFQKKAKQQLIEKSKEVEKANKELKDFVYTVSHDLKEPLFSIEGYVRRLHEKYKDTYDERSNKYSNRIQANIELMSNRIYEILEVIKVGTVTYNFRDTDSEDIIKDVVQTLEGKIESNNINILVKRNLPTILCDEEKIRDVFLNLVTNAIKFMDDDKQRQITIGCDKDGNFYKFFVEDTGIGIRKEYQEQVFKIFNRLRDIEAEGTGVGLVIVKKIIELHKGKIWIESPVGNGKGSRFCFTISISRQ